MIKQRILGLALALALLGSIGFAATARAQSSGDDVTILGSSTSVTQLTLNTTQIEFGNQLTFLGTGNLGAGVFACAGTSASPYGSTFVAPDLNVTVVSSESYNLTRDVQPNNQFYPRLLSKDIARSGLCGTDTAGRFIVGHGVGDPPQPVASGQGSTDNTGRTHVQSFTFDVVAGDDTGDKATNIVYTATAI